jgi:CheY-like chemotaxis protein
MLASAKLQIGCMSAELTNRDHKLAVEEIEKILADSIGIARSLSMDLSPPILHEAGLAAGLEWLVRSMREKHDLTVELNLQACADLSEHINVLAFESVRELLFNTVKHANVKCAKVSLQQEDGHHVRITVSDSGVGFDVSRLETGPGSSSGGFGLFSIRERTSLIGGSLQIQSAPGQGSCFTLILPSMVAFTDAFSDHTVASVPTFGLEISTKRAVTQVLLADDHTLFRDGIARILSREADIEVVGQATNGQQVIEMARELRPHVILMDISMPGINGIEATAVIHKEFPEIRIIGLSMYEDLERARVMYQAGAVDYKNKACAASELLSAVRA